MADLTAVFLTCHLAKAPQNENAAQTLDDKHINDEAPLAQLAPSDTATSNALRSDLSANSSLRHQKHDIQDGTHVMVQSPACTICMVHARQAHLKRHNAQIFLGAVVITLEHLAQRSIIHVLARECARVTCRYTDSIELASSVMHDEAT